MIPIFLVGGTNYHINFEDNYAKDLKVYGCSFSRTDSTIGKLLFGVYTLAFHHNISDAPVYIYNNIFSYIHDNKFSSSAVWFSSWRHTNYDEGLQKHGFKYLTRITLLHHNLVGKLSSSENHNRTILYEID